jgi:hypothetical protein
MLPNHRRNNGLGRNSASKYLATNLLFLEQENPILISRLWDDGDELNFKKHEPRIEEHKKKKKAKNGI